MWSGSKLMLVFLVCCILDFCCKKMDAMPYPLLRYGGKIFLSECKYGKQCKRNDGFATVPWGSPLDGQDMKVICPMQDDYLETKDLSLLHVPEWLNSHSDPVGRCPVKLQRVTDHNLIWPQKLVAVKCACERSRCTERGSHICYTVYVLRLVLRRVEGLSKELIAIDCICAAQRAKLIKFSTPSLID